MLRLVAFAVVVLTVLPVRSVSAQSADGPPVVVTTGEGVVTRAPDRGWVTIRAESRAKDPKEAQRLNTTAMDAVMAKLKSMGFGPETIKTVSYDLQPEFDYNNGRQTLRGYVATNAIEVRVDDITRVGEVVTAAVGSGATSIGGLRFDLKDGDRAEREALRLAVQDARARADAAANGAGMRVERVVRIEEQRATIPRPMPMMREMAQAGVANATLPITAGTMEIRALVTLTAAIK